MGKLKPTEERQAAAYVRYRQKPSLWVEDKIAIDLARCRDRAVLETWLDQPGQRGLHHWCRQRLAAGQLELDASRSYQAEALDAMAAPGYYAFQWANGTAKTTTAALLVHWFLDCYDDSRALTTAGTWSQLKEQLWREIPLWAEHAREPIIATGRLTKTTIDAAPDWAAFSRAAEKADTFEGVHAKHILVLMDEAKAVKPEIFGAVRRILRGNPESMFWFVCLSSPGSPTGPFYDITTGRQSHRWKVFRLSAYESERIALDQIGSDATDLGEHSPLFVAMVLGEFPEESDDTVIPVSYAQANVKRVVSDEGARYLGVDVARFGEDETALVSLFGRRAEVSSVYQGKDTVWTTGRIGELHDRWKYAEIGIDDSGVGGGVTDQCRTNSMPVRAINFGSKDGLTQPDRYVDIKAQMYFILRDELEAGAKDPGNPEVGLCLPDDNKLIHQLCMQQYEFDNQQRRKVEGHAKLKARGEHSPDRADALAIANLLRCRQFNRRHRAIAQETLIEGHHVGVGASVLKADF